MASPAVPRGPRKDGPLSSIEAFVDEGLGNSSHLIDLGDGRGLVIDPWRDTRGYAAAASRRGLEIAFAAETHLHADFVSGSRELAARGAHVLAPQAARYGFGVEALRGGDELELGAFRLRCIATPGHAPEHVSFLLWASSAPVALFSGGALLPGAVARTDLVSPAQTEPLARALFRSLHGPLAELPDELPVFPTHGSGSFCAAGSSDRLRSTTLGEERARNPFLLAGDEDLFVDRLLASYGTYPAYFRRLREVNRAGPRPVAGSPLLPPLDPDEFEAQLERGAALVDVRPVEEFADSHVSGSISIELRPEFASWLGWLVDLDRRVAFVVGADQSPEEVARRALGVGFEGLAGVLTGVDRWAASGRPTRSLRLAADEDILSGHVVDVRQASEFAHHRLPGARLAELGSLVPDIRAALAPALATDEELIFTCARGVRAMSAASLAEGAGIRSAVLLGSPRGWSVRTGIALEMGESGQGRPAVS